MLENIEKIVVIVGCQRSGTTLLGQILGAHRKTWMIDEGENLYDWFNSYINDTDDSNERWNKTLAKSLDKYKPEHRRLVEHADGGLSLSKKVTHLILKAPNLTYNYRELSRLSIPVSILYMVRDPRSVVASMKKLEQIPMVKNQLRLINQYSDLVSEYNNEITMLEDEKVAEHIKRALLWRIKSGLMDRFTECGLATLVLRYEDLVKDIKYACEQITHHVGLGFDSQMLAHESIYTGLGPGKTDRSRPIDQQSICRWESVLSPEQEKGVLGIADPTIRSQGLDYTSAI